MALETIIADNRLTNAGLRLALRRLGAAVESSQPNRSNGAGVAFMDVAVELHARNREAGWWSHIDTGLPKERNVGELLMLMVSELAEFPHYPDSESKMDDKLPHRLMAEVELADCAIRIFDTVGALAPAAHLAFVAGLNFAPFEDTLAWRMADVTLMRIVRMLAEAMEYHRKNRVLTVPATQVIPTAGDNPTVTVRGFDWYLGHAAFAIFDFGWRLGLDVPGAIAEKVEYNQQREDHKIEARKQDGGKQY